MKRNLLKLALCAMAALPLGAWAETSTLYYRTVAGTETGATAWSSTDATEWSGSTFVEGSGLKVTDASTITATKSVSYTANSILTYTATWQISGGNNGGGSKNNYVYLKLGNSLQLSYYQREKILKVDIGETSATIVTFTKEELTATDVSITYKVNTNTGVITELSISGVDPDNSNMAFSYSLSNIEEAERSLSITTNYTDNILGSVKAANTCRGNCILKSLKIEQETQDIASYGYTVYYKLGETTIKTITGSAALNSAIPVLSTTNAFYGDDAYSSNKYFIIADDAPVQAITNNAESNVLNVPVRVPYSTTLTVTRTFDGVSEGSSFISKNLTETDEKVANWVYTFPYYVQKDSKWYRATLKDGNFGEEGTFTTENINKTIEYTIDNSVVAFYDYEHNSVVDDISLSGGSQNPYQQLQAIGTLSIGKYEITVMQVGNYGATLYKNYTSAESKGNELATFNSNVRTNTVTLTEEASNVQVYTGSNGRYDYVLVRKIADIVPVTITSAKYATFCSDKALDFSETDVKAYTAKVNGSSVKLTEIEDGIVPANAGVVLYCETADTYPIPVTTDDATEYDALDNELIGINVRTLVMYNGEGSKKNYILSNEASGVGFYKATTSGAYLAANRAYLSTTGVVASRSFLGFDDETTGIEELKNSKTEELKSYYNLNGQRVATPTKGLYIVNGKKVIINK